MDNLLTKIGRNMEQKDQIKADVNYVEIKINSGDKQCFFRFPEGMSLGQAYDASFALLNKVSDMAREAVEALKKKEDARPTALSQDDPQLSDKESKDQVN